jgi:hypothetical protein
MSAELTHAEFDTQPTMRVWRLPDRVWFESPGRSVDRRTCRRYLVQTGSNSFSIMDHDDVVEATDMPEDAVNKQLEPLPIIIT